MVITGLLTPQRSNQHPAPPPSVLLGPGPMMRRFVGGLLAVFLLALCEDLAADIVALDADTAHLSVTPHLSIYRDPSGKMGLAEVQQAWERGQSSPRPVSWLTFGFTADAIWMRFRLQNQDRVLLTGLVELNSPRMDEVDGYVLYDGGRIEHFAGGNARTSSPSMMVTRCPTFPVSVAPGEQAEILVRVRSETSIQLPLRLWTQKTFAEAQAADAVAYAGLFGYWSALIVLGFVFGAASRDSGYVIYSLKTAAIFVICLILSGYWRWLGLPFGATLAKTGVILIGELGVVIVLLFSQRLLGLDQLMPRVSRWMTRASWAGCVFAVGLVSIPYRVAYPLFVAHLLLLGASIMAVAAMAWYRGCRVARIYLAAWSAFWICHGVSLSTFLVRQPLAHLPWVYVLIGGVLSSTLFLTAMGERIREIRQGALEAEKQLLAAARKSSEALRLWVCQEQSLIRDLHDGFGGLIANLAILAELGRREAATSPDRDRFSRISQMASDGGQEIRTLMNSLEVRDMSWPDFLDECRRHGQTALDSHGIAFVLEADGHPAHPGPGVVAGLSLMRVVKEALNNAVKHANCTKVGVKINFSADHLRLTVRDDGVGMTVEDGNSRDCRGLRNMKHRIRELSGTLTTRCDLGMELVIDLPLPLAHQGGAVEPSVEA